MTPTHFLAFSFVRARPRVEDPRLLLVSVGFAVFEGISSSCLTLSRWCPLRSPWLLRGGCSPAVFLVERPTTTDDDGPLPTLLSIRCLRLSGSTLDPTTLTLDRVLSLSTQRVWYYIIVAEKAA